MFWAEKIKICCFVQNIKQEVHVLVVQTINYLNNFDGKSLLIALLVNILKLLLTFSKKPISKYNTF